MPIPQKIRFIASLILETRSNPFYCLSPFFVRSVLVMNIHSPTQPIQRRLLRSQRVRAVGDRANTTDGFTILEALVAMVVAAIMIAVITPPMFLATAARVQQRRAQQSLQLAQSEIDRVRATVERGAYTATELPTAVGATLANVAAASTVHGQLKSTSSSGCNAYNGSTVASSALLPIDINGDCTSDYLVQSFRTTGPPGTAVPVTGFQMEVRVYADIPQLRANLGQLTATPARLSSNGGFGGATRQPLAVLRSTIVRPDTQNSLQDYQTICTNGGC